MRYLASLSSCPSFDRMIYQDMDIVYFGHSSFIISGKSASVVTDPFDPKKVGLKFPKVQADIVTVSHDHGDHNKVDLVEGAKVINGPGEYEVKGISLIGISTYHDEKKGKLRGKNTIYVIEVDGVRIVHLGDIGHKLTEKEQELIGDVDILMVPVGGVYTIGDAQAAEIVRGFEPNITIPMHYQMKGLDPKTFSKLSTVDHFLSDVSLPVERLNKLSVKKDTLGEDQKVVILEKR